ncbi:MAG: BspA family leucine-rich repeat surface protein, partial [Bacteroidales bacterium]|nr:BspA family leucine-rich repeat surface protein [Bacteroidales bacterium]
NACSYVRVAISSPFLAYLDEIEIIARGGENIAGPHLVGITPQGVPFTEYSGRGGSDRVSVKFPATKHIDARRSYFYIPLPAVKLSAGLAFVLKGDFAGDPTVNLTSSTATLERNTVLVMEEYRLRSEEAQIGDVVYETVKEAFTAANASDEDVTVKLLRSCTAASKLPLNNKGTGAVTLDLNGKTLTLKDTLVVDGRKFTVTDNFSDNPAEQGTIKFKYTGSSKAHYAIYTKNSAETHWLKGNLDVTGCRGIYYTSGAFGTISGGTITTRGYICAGVSGTGKELVVDGDVTMNAGANNTIYLWGGKLRISAGKFYNTSGASIYNSPAEGVIYVSGGYFSSPNINTIARGEGTAYVYGGCHNKAVQPYYALDENGGTYANALNDDPETAEDFPFKVVPAAASDFAAHGVRGTYSWDYATVEAAAKNATLTAGANTVQLLNDATTGSVLEFSNPSYAMTLDLNGHKITSTASPAISVGNNSKLTILDSSTEGTGEVATTGATALEVAGTVNFNGGSLTASDKAITVNGGNLTVLDGWFYGGTSDIGGTGDIKLSSGKFKNKPDAATIEEGNAAMPLSPAESHNGRDYNWLIKRGYTVLDAGANFNMAIKSLANGTTVTAATSLDNAITKIVFKVNQDLTSVTGADVSALQDGSIIASFDGGVVTVSTNYPSLRSGESLASMFRDLRSCTEIEGFELVDTREATEANQMFYRSMMLETVNISKMKTGKIAKMRSLFFGTPSLKQEVYDFSGWDTSSAADMAYMFDSTGARILDLTSFDTSNDTTMNYMFANCYNLEEVKLSSFNTSNVKNMDNMFRNCQNLVNLDLKNFSTANVTNLRSFCYQCYKLKTIDMSNFNTKKVTLFSYMFNDCNELETILVGDNFSGNSATTLYDFCRNCYKLKTLDMSHFVTTDALTSCYRAFIDCQSIKELDLSGFRTSKVTTFYAMFDRCYALETLHMENFTFGAANTQMRYLWYGCKNMKNLYVGSNPWTNPTSTQYIVDAVGSADEAATGFAYDATPESPCQIWCTEPSFISRFLTKKGVNWTGGGSSYFYGDRMRKLVAAGKLVFRYPGYNNPWTFDPSYDPATATGGPVVAKIIAPTE